MARHSEQTAGQRVYGRLVAETGFLRDGLAGFRRLRFCRPELDNMGGFLQRVQYERFAGSASAVHGASRLLGAAQRGG